MIRIQQLNLQIKNFQTEAEYLVYQKKELEKKILKILKVSSKELISFQIVRRSLDARKRPILIYSYIVDASVTNERDVFARCRNKNVSIIEEKEYCFPQKDACFKSISPVIVVFSKKLILYI